MGHLNVHSKIRFQYHLFKFSSIKNQIMIQFDPQHVGPASVIKESVQVLRNPPFLNGSKWVRPRDNF